MNRFIQSAVLTGCLLLGVSGSAVAAVMQVPFELYLDGSYQPTNASVELPFEAIGKPASAWSPGAADAANAAFAQLVAAIANGSAEQVEKLFTAEVPAARPFADSRTGVVRNPAPPTPREFMERYRQTFAPFGSIRVVGRIPLGTDYLYVWEGKSPQGSLIRAFHAYRKGPQVRFSEVTSQRPFDAFLVNVLGRSREERWHQPTGQASDLLIPLSGEYPVQLRVPVTPRQTIEHAQTGTDVLHRFTTLAKSGQFQSLADVVTAPSMVKLSKWVASVPASQKAAFQNFLGEPRRVLKVVPLGNADLVFWVHARGTPQPEDLQYSYVYYSPGGPKLANILMQGLQDDVFTGNSAIAKWIGVAAPENAPAAR